MSSASVADWIAAIATTVLAAMAILTSNGTSRVRIPWAKALSPDPPLPDVGKILADLERVVQIQAEMIKALQVRQNTIVDMLGEVVEVLENSSN